MRRAGAHDAHGRTEPSGAARTHVSVFVARVVPPIVLALVVRVGQLAVCLSSGVEQALRASLVWRDQVLVLVRIVDLRIERSLRDV